MRYYPVFLDLKDKPVVVIGGGEVALRKVEGLLDAGAVVAVVSPQLHPELATLLQKERIRQIARDYRTGDLEGYSLAFVATDDRSANAAVATEGRERRIWVNAVDDIPNCDFIMPSIITRGDVVVAISTGGGSPAAARKIREEMEGFLTEEYALLLDVAAEVRQELRESGTIVDSDTWNAALDGDFRRLLRQGKRAEAKQQLLRSLLEPARAK
jgi:precorrin-2 dehydrogenase/sirohydrochlorin ferrochelatase